MSIRRSKNVEMTRNIITGFRTSLFNAMKEDSTSMEKRDERMHEKMKRKKANETAWKDTLISLKKARISHAVNAP